MYHLYVDFDGVLADCSPTAEKVLGKTNLSQKEFWSVANLPNFFLDLPPTKDAKSLMRYLWDKYNRGFLNSVKALTATGNNFVDVGLQKKMWAEREHLFPREGVILVRSGEDKAVYATPRSILIDDTVAVIQNWERHGGIGVLHTSYEDTVKQLETILMRL